MFLLIEGKGIYEFVSAAEILNKLDKYADLLLLET